MTHFSKSDCIAVFYQKITLLSIHNFNAISNYKESGPSAATPTQGPVLFIAPGPELALHGPEYHKCWDESFYLRVSLPVFLKFSQNFGLLQPFCFA